MGDVVGNTEVGNTEPQQRAPQAHVGRLAVVCMVGLGLALAVTGIVYQRGQTRRCLAFLGVEPARRLSEASHVELLRLTAGSQPGQLVVLDRRDVSSAKGLVHLRRGLVEDANYDWSRLAPAGNGGRLPAEAWNWGIAFADSAAAVESGHATVLVLSLPEDRGAQSGWLAVVGAPGRVGLGRIERGLAVWIRAAVSESPQP